LGELAAKEFDEAARAGTAVAAQETRAKQEMTTWKMSCVFERFQSAGGGLFLLQIVEKAL